MKLLIVACMATAFAGSAMAADALPKAFQGTWINAEGGACSLIVRPNSISVCGPSKQFKLISIEAGDEEFNRATIKWKSTPRARTTVEVYRLIKIKGRQGMIVVNAEALLTIDLYWKRR